MATGLLTSAETVSEVLLFTTDSNILEKVAQHDEKAGVSISSSSFFFFFVPPIYFFTIYYKLYT